MTEANGDLVKYTVKELLLEIREQVSILDKRLDQLEKDMQEGKETVKAMLLPDYHGFKANMTLFEKETQVHLAKLERAIEVDQKFHDVNVPTFKLLVDRVSTLERNSVTEEAVSKYRKWLMYTAIPAAAGAGWALFKVILWLSGNHSTIP